MKVVFLLFLGTYLCSCPFQVYDELVYTPSQLGDLVPYDLDIEPTLQSVGLAVGFKTMNKTIVTVDKTEKDQHDPPPLTPPVVLPPPPPMAERMMVDYA